MAVYSGTTYDPARLLATLEDMRRRKADQEFQMKIYNQQRADAERQRRQDEERAIMEQRNQYAMQNQAPAVDNRMVLAQEIADLDREYAKTSGMGGTLGGTIAEHGNALKEMYNNLYGGNYAMRQWGTGDIQSFGGGRIEQEPDPNVGPSKEVQRQIAADEGERDAALRIRMQELQNEGLVAREEAKPTKPEKPPKQERTGIEKLTVADLQREANVEVAGDDKSGMARRNAARQELNKRFGIGQTAKQEEVVVPGEIITKAVENEAIIRDRINTLGVNNAEGQGIMAALQAVMKIPDPVNRARALQNIVNQFRTAR